MKKSIFTLATLALVFSLSLVSCGSKKKKNKGTVDLDPKEATLNFGETLDIKPVFSKDGEAKNQTYKWSSSNEEVATVVKGRVEARRIGDAIISYKSDDLTAKSKITVAPRSSLLNGFEFKKGVDETYLINNAPRGYQKDATSTKDFLVLKSSDKQIPALIYNLENNKLKVLYIILEDTSDNKEKAKFYIEERFKDLETQKQGIYFYENVSQTQFPKRTVFGVFEKPTNINGSSYSLGVKVMDKSVL